jgi:hypothetical protein
MSFDDFFRKVRPNERLQITANGLVLGPSMHFFELAVFDARLYI